MTTYEAFISYLEAYNEKARLEADPLMEEGAIEEEESSFSGVVMIGKIKEFEDAKFTIDSVFPAKIQEQQEIMDMATPPIEAFFGGKDIERVDMANGQSILFAEGTITVEGTADLSPIG